MRAKIFFVHTGNETFTEIDRDLLSTSFDVSDFHASRKFPVDIVRYWQGVKSTDAVFCWFASWNSMWALLIAKFFHKPSVLVIGGYDLANLPNADYGQQRGGLGKWVSRYAIRLASTLFTNSYYSQMEAEQNAGITANRVKVIYHGVPDPFDALPQIPKERMALTVGKVDVPNLKRKGLVPFVRTAALLPNIQFVLVGAWSDDSIEYLRSIATKNVHFTGRISKEVLLNYYQKASVYVQVSLHEGFGLSVAESMLAGCIPVITKAGSLPEVVGDCGIVCESSEPEDIARSIMIVLNSSPETRGRIRERIITHFPLSLRQASLNQIIQDQFGQAHGKH
ncbi:MAG: glycosyltransferase [Pelolinea sp.]|nr:glycosyltransferase [Pelolinea sp.]